jgi:very-short-patch-repair endonuclease
MTGKEIFSTPRGKRPSKEQKAPLPEDILDHCRSMRTNPTDAETKLWRLLRSRQLADFKFRRQHPVGRYILDFYCHTARVGIELDGGQHDLEEQGRYDVVRDKALAGKGIRVLRFWDTDVLRNTRGVLEKIWCTLLSGSPSPQPSPRGRGRGWGAMKVPHPCPLPGGEGGDVGVGRGVCPMHRRASTRPGHLMIGGSPNPPLPLGEGRGEGAPGRVPTPAEAATLRQNNGIPRPPL